MYIQVTYKMYVKLLGTFNFSKFLENNEWIHVHTCIINRQDISI